jgi:hypothetical protein
MTAKKRTPAQRAATKRMLAANRKRHIRPSKTLLVRAIEASDKAVELESAGNLSQAFKWHNHAAKLYEQLGENIMVYTHRARASDIFNSGLLAPWQLPRLP